MAADRRAAELHQQAIARAPAAPEEAVALLREAVAREPGLVAAQEHLGTLLAALGRDAEAIAAWRAALALAPGNASLWRRLAALLRTAGGDPLEALAACRHARAAASAAPAGERAVIARETGLALLAAGRPETALAALLQARALDAGLAGVAAPLGAALLARGHDGEAVGALRAAVAERADDHASRALLARALAARGRAPDAIALLRRGLARSPGAAVLVIALARALLAAGRAGAALATLGALPDDGPGEALVVAGMSLRALGRPSEAVARLAAACEQAPGDAEARCQLALARLAQGDFAGGWGDFALRLHDHPDPPAEARLRLPRWTGEQSLAGRHILLHAEDSAEDMLQFLRYVPMVAACGAFVQLRVPAAWHDLVVAMPALVAWPAIRLLAPGAAAAACDLRAALADLPGAFATTLPTIPAVVPYLAAPAGRLRHWRAALPPEVRHIALCWAGAVPLAGPSLAGLVDGLAAALPDARLYGLGPAGAPVPDARLCDLRARTADPAELAAALMCMDLVLAVDGPVLHLAGALARPTIALLGPGADWRWLTGRRDSPWYPTLQLCRGGIDIDAVVATVVDADIPAARDAESVGQERGRKQASGAF